MPDTRFVTIHGHRRAYALGGRELGTAPVLLLLHGLACDRHTWDPVWDRLAERYTLVAPDLLGHGESDKPRGDYSLGGYANGMRDLLTVLGIDRVSVVGHSFGGGIAMQFAYQYPERTERLLLVDPGGLGPEVTALIRALSLPGYDLALRMMTLPLVRQANMTGLRLLKALRLPHTHDLDEVARILGCLGDRDTRRATHALVSGVVDWRGQVVTMRDRAYLTEAMPMCVLWGADDKVIPASHAAELAALSPEARVVVMAKAGHFPHKDHPDDFAELVESFVSGTAPATYSRARMRRLLKAGGPPRLEPVASELA